MPDKPKAEPGAAPAPTPAGGFKAWLPLVVTLLAMPALAYGTVHFWILPKMKPPVAAAGDAAEAGAEAEPSAAAAGHEGGSGTTGTAGGTGRRNTSVRLEKMVVNVSGTMGTRFLMASITLVGNKAGFKETIEANRDQLMDLAASTLSSKTIADLERPGARNLLKTELISVINNAMGENLVRDIYIPEMAIQ